MERRENLMGEMQFRGYFPGVIGRITEIHATYYYENWGFDATFETQVGSELSDFINKFQEGRDGFWVVTLGEKLAGSVAIDGWNAETEGARLRWFIVAPEFQGIGIGKALLARAVSFCEEKGYRRIYLWTFEGLDVARALYERHRFRLCEERDVSQWGQRLKEQMFELNFQV